MAGAASVHIVRPQAKSEARVTWKIHREVVLLLGWGRAILLQLAHPLVAAGVKDHSSFLGSGQSVKRLRRTLDSMLALTFGERGQAEEAARIINAIHDRVHGKLAEPAGIFPAGTPYSAHDPELLRWVHATLVDSFMLTYELYVGPLTEEEKDQYCLESSDIEPMLGIPRGYLPRTAPHLEGYITRMFASGQIVVSANARALAHEVLYPPFLWPSQPLLWLLRLSTAGMLPATIRESYGLEWTARRQKALQLSAHIARGFLRITPPVLRYWKSYRTAVGRCEEKELKILRA